MRERDDVADREIEVETHITTATLDGFGPFEAFGERADGAVLIFQGRVRETNEGRAVTGITYEAYGEMAERELEDICRRAAVRFPVGSVFAAHRVGELSVGEVSVAVGVTAAHRADAYDASRWIIEEIKVRLPIWKHEHFDDGSSHWVGASGIAPASDPDG